MVKATSLAFVTLLAVIAGVQGRQLLQAPSGSASTVVVRWAVPANGVLDAVRVPLGGNVTFSWSGQHDLWEIPSAQCPSSFTNSGSIRRIAPASSGGTATVNFNTTAIRYFACSVSNHCQEGQLIAVRVNGAAAPAPGPAGATAPRRADGNGYGGNSTPSYAGGASSAYGSTGTNSTGSGTTSTSSGYGSSGVNNTPGYGGGSSSNYGTSGTGR